MWSPSTYPLIMSIQKLQGSNWRGLGLNPHLNFPSNQTISVEIWTLTDKITWPISPPHFRKFEHCYEPNTISCHFSHILSQVFNISPYHTIYISTVRYMHIRPFCRKFSREGPPYSSTTLSRASAHGFRLCFQFSCALYSGVSLALHLLQILYPPVDTNLSIILKIVHASHGSKVIY